MLTSVQSGMLNLGAFASGVVAAVTANANAQTIQSVEAPATALIQSRIEAFADIQKKIELLKSDLKSDVSFAREFKSNPTRVMTERGISLDAQFEILGEEKYFEGVEFVCNGTCACSGCCATSKLLDFENVRV
jgi:hypothetical protein